MLSNKVLVYYRLASVKTQSKAGRERRCAAVSTTPEYMMRVLINNNMGGFPRWSSAGSNATEGYNEMTVNRTNREVTVPVL